MEGVTLSILVLASVLLDLDECNLLIQEPVLPLSRHVG